MKRDGLAITVERRGTSHRITLRHLSHPRLHVQSAKDHTGRETAPRGVDLQGRTLKTIRTKGALGGKFINFLLDIGATYSVLTEAPGPLSFQSASIVGLSGQAKRYYFSCSLSCNWDSMLFSHEFLIVPESPLPLLGRDKLSKVHASVFMNMEPSLSLPLIEENVNPRV